MGMVLGILRRMSPAQELSEFLNVVDAQQPNPANRQRRQWNWTLIVAVLALLIALAAWLEPRYSAHRDQDLKNAIKIEVTDQLREPLTKQEDMRVQIGEIQGELKRISLTQIGTADEKTFSTSLPRLHRLMVVPGIRHPQKHTIPCSRKAAPSSRIIP